MRQPVMPLTVPAQYVCKSVQFIFVALGGVYQFSPPLVNIVPETTSTSPVRLALTAATPVVEKLMVAPLRLTDVGVQRTLTVQVPPPATVPPVQVPPLTMATEVGEPIAIAALTPFAG